MSRQHAPTEAAHEAAPAVEAPAQATHEDPAVQEQYSQRSLSEIGRMYGGAPLQPRTGRGADRARQSHAQIQRMYGTDAAGPRPLEPDVRQDMESAFGEPFGDVRIHEDNVAQAAGAQAVTRGTDIHFAPGEYAPDTDRGRALLGHELTHVIQQRRGEAGGDQARELGDETAGSDRPPLEAEADRVGERVASGQLTGTIAGGIESGTEQHQNPDEKAQPDVLPPPIMVTWSGDPFKLSLRRVGRGTSNDYLYVDILYIGGRPTGDQSGGHRSAQTLRMSLGWAALKTSVKSQNANEVVLDLLGNEKLLAKLTHKMEPRLKPEAEKGREHRIAIASGGRQFESATILVHDDSVVAPPPKPDYQDDVPGEKPESRLKAGGASQIRIDGDGDQHKELLLLIKESAEHYAPQRPKAVVVDVTQIASGVKHTATLALPDSEFSGALHSVVREITDGHAPTTIALQHEAALTIPPPLRDGTSVIYTLRGPLGATELTFPEEPAGAGPHTIATAEKPVSIGGLHSVDVRLGAFADPFRITIDPSAKTLGLSPKDTHKGGGPVDGVGVAVTLPVVKSLRVLQGDGVSVALDLDEDGKPDVHLFDTMEAMYDDGNAEAARRHTVRAVGPALGRELLAYAKIENGNFIGPFSNRTALDHAVGSNARAISGLQDQAELGTYEKNIDAFEGAMVAARHQAFEQGLIDDKIYTNWALLSADLIVLRAQIAGQRSDPKKRVDVAMQFKAAAHADAFFAALGAATKGRERVTRVDSGLGWAQTSTENPYTHEEKTTSWSVFGGTETTTNAFAGVGAQLRFSQFDDAFKAYNALVGGLDKWIVTKLKEKNTPEGKQAAQRLEYLGAMRTELGKLEGVKPTRLQAVFHPDAGYKESREVPEVPLSLYFWKTKDQWKLKDLTNPNNTFEDEVDAKEGETEPPLSLFKELDYKSHFPKGIIHYQIPGGSGGQLKTTERRTFSDWLTYIGLGVAAVGLGLATFGTGTVAVAGAWALAASSAIGAVAAGAHMVEEEDHGNLSGDEMAVDIAQIASGLLGASQLAAGRLVMSAGTASKAGKAWTGAAAQIAKWSQAGYVPLTIGAIGADVVTVALASKELAAQLDEIEKSAPAGEKSRLKAMLISQFAITGGMVALSIKGELPSLKPGSRSLYIYTPKDGGPLVAAHMEKPADIKFSQATVDAKTSDGMPMDELIHAMKTGGWKHDPIDVVNVDGELISIDNRRLYAARAAGIEVPVKMHGAGERLPEVQISGERFKLDADLYELADGQMSGVKPTDGVTTPKYAAGAVAQNWGEAALFRAVNQGKRTGLPFPMRSTYSTPTVTNKEMSSRERRELGIPNAAAANDVARIETKNLVASIQDGSLDKQIFNTKASDGSTFGHWYKQWIESAEPVKLDADGLGKHRPNLPPNMPPEFEPLIARMIADGDIVNNVKIRAHARQIAKDFPDLRIDPSDSKYPEARAKLVAKYGEPMVKRYESALLANDPVAFGQVKRVLDDGALETLRAYLPGEEIYITGGAATAGRALADIAEVKILVVVPDGTAAKKIAKLEARANEPVLATTPEFARATGRGHVRVNATVRTRRDAFAAITLDDGATQSSHVRVDNHSRPVP